MICALSGYLLHTSQLSNFSDQRYYDNHNVEIYGAPVTEPRPMGRYKKEVVLHIIPQLGQTTPFDGQQILATFPAEIPLEIGRILKLQGRLRTPDPALNPKSFDRARNLKRKSIALDFFVTQSSLTSEYSMKHTLHRWAFEARVWIRNRLTLGIEDTDAAKIILAMFLGEKPADGREIMNDFKYSGTIHVFAVSGLHVMMIGAIFTLLLRLCGLGVKVWVPAVITIMLFYATVTGMNPPAMRAVIMGATVLLSIMILRKPSLANSLWLSALIAMIWDTQTIFTAGFQLSYAVLFMIILTGNWWSARWAWITATEPFLPRSLYSPSQRFSLAIRKKIAATFSVSSSAWTGSSLLIWTYFGLITPIAILASLPLALNVFSLLATCCMSLSIGGLSDPLAREINQLNTLNATSAHYLSRSFASLPGAYYQDAPWSTGERVVIYSIPSGGAGCYISIGGGVMIDAASKREFYQHIWPSLSKNGARVDSLIASHADGNHIQGLAQSISRLPIKQLLIGSRGNRSSSVNSLMQQAEASGLNIVAMEQNVFSISPETTLEVLYTGSTENLLADDRCSVFLLTWRGKKILFLNDSGFLFEQWLSKTERTITADIIILGKHSLENSISVHSIRRLNPRTVIASNDPFSEDQLRTTEWKKELLASGAQLILLNESGAVTITLSDSELELSTFLSQ